MVRSCETTGSAKAAALAGRPDRGTRGARQVGRPHRLARLPQHARAAQQQLDLGFAREPALGEADIARRLVDAKAAPRVPAFDVADEPQGAAQALGGGGRLGERARDGVLEPAQVLQALELGDVAPDAAVALEAAALVEARLAAERQPYDAAVLGRVLQLEIAERLVPLELGAVALPVAFAEIQRGLIPVLAPDVGKRISGIVRTSARDHGEAEFRVLLPVPVREQLDERRWLALLRMRGTVRRGARDRHASHCAAIYT